MNLFLPVLLLLPGYSGWILAAASKFFSIFEFFTSGIGVWTRFFLSASRTKLSLLQTTADIQFIPRPVWVFGVIFAFASASSGSGPSCGGWHFTHVLLFSNHTTCFFSRVDFRSHTCTCFFRFFFCIRYHFYWTL